MDVSEIRVDLRVIIMTTLIAAVVFFYFRRNNISEAAPSRPHTPHTADTVSCVLPVLPADEVCVNCGSKGGEDGVKLKNCTACRLVRYCGLDCQRAHRKQHKKTCKKRAAELKEERLYSQGHERPEGDFCPICTLPIPLPMAEHSGFMACCMKLVCNGCIFAAQNKGILDCPFCRAPYADNDADRLAMLQARAEKKDPVAIYHLGIKYDFGSLGLQKDTRKAVELWTEAAELGSIEALFNLGDAYIEGEGVQEDKAKGVRLLEKAAMQGSIRSRHNLGHFEAERGNYYRALR